jgi:hypothetical protein
MAEKELQKEFTTNQNHFRVIAALDFIRPENWIHDFYRGPGRPKIDRETFFRAFVAKKVLNELI